MAMVTGCGREDKEATLTYPDELKTYIDTYLYYKQSWVDTNILFKFKDGPINDNPRIRAACKGGVITIRKDTWDNLSHLGKELLIFHELGHCDLLRHHNDRMKADGCMESIMYRYLKTSCYTEDSRLYYIRELFDRR